MTAQAKPGPQRRRTEAGALAEAASQAPVSELEPVSAIVGALEEEIVLGRLHPRERLVEDALMERFKAKRHVVREALAALDRMGVVERRRNVGALVRSFTATEVVELYALRTLLEAEAARTLKMPVSADRLEELITVQRRHDKAVEAGDPRAVYTNNVAFHDTLFGLADNATLHQAIKEYARRTHAIRFISLTSRAYRERARHEHWKMIEALQANDREALVALCSDHLTPSRDVYLGAHVELGYSAA